MVPEDIILIRDIGKNIKKGLEVVESSPKFIGGYISYGYHHFYRDDRHKVCAYSINPVLACYVGKVIDFDIFTYDESNVDAMTKEWKDIHIPYDVMYDTLHETYKHKKKPETNRLDHIINYLYHDLNKSMVEISDILIEFSENIVSTPRP